MASKRVLADMDPDYEDITKDQVKRQRIIEEDAKQASVKKIERIVQTQFQMEIENKEAEVTEADQRLHQVRSMMDRLRAVVVANFYSCLQQTPGKVQSMATAPPPSIHPTVKKHLGKAPAGVAVKQEQSDLPSTQKSRTSLPSSSALEVSSAKNSASTSSAAAPQPATSTTATTDGVQPLRQEQERESSRFTVKKRIIVGNVSRFILPDQREPNDQSTHKWMVYVRGPSDDQRIDSFVSKVWFFLHPSYRPNDLVEVSAPPFHLTRRGWGVFPVRVQLHFWDPRNKRVDIIHNLQLDKTYTGLQTLGAETVVEVELYKDRAPLSSRSHPPSVPALSSQVVIEAAVKQEAQDPQPVITKTIQHCRCGADSCKCFCSNGKVVSDLSGTQKGKGSAPLDLNVTVKDEPPDEYEMEGCLRNSDVVPAPTVASQACLPSQQNTTGALGESFPHLASQETPDTRVTDEDACGTSGSAVQRKVVVVRGSDGLPCQSVVCKQTSGSGGAVFSRDGKSKPALSAVSLVKASLLSAVGPKSGTTVSSSVSSDAAAASCRVISCPQAVPAKAVSLLPGSKAKSLLSGAQVLNAGQQPRGGDCTKTPNTSAPPMQVLLVDSAPHAGKGAMAGTSLLASATASFSKAGEEKPAAAGSLPRLQVTSQGLKPITPNGQARKASGVCHAASTQLARGGASVASMQVQSQTVHSQSIHRGACVVSMDTQSRGPAPTASSTSNATQSSAGGMRSLLNTAPQPAIQALLHRLGSSGSSAVASLTPSSGTSPSFSSSSSSSLPAALSSSSSSSLTSATLSPRDSYIIANLNNRKVLMRIDSSSLKVIRDANSSGQASGSVSSGSSVKQSTNLSAPLSTPLPVQFALQVQPSAPSTQPGLSQSTGASSLPSSLAHRTSKPSHKPSQWPQVVDSRGQSAKSLAGMELARAKAALQGSAGQGLASKAAMQLARLKAAMQEKKPTEAPTPKSRCARWFSQGLGSSLVSLFTQRDGAEQLNGLAEDLPHNAAVEVKVIGRPDDEAEKRIMVLKKKMECGDFMVTSPVPDLSVEEYSDVQSLVRAAALRHPLLAPTTEKAVHPYSATTLEHWTSWHPAKRNAAEWMRASTVKKYLQRHLQPDSVYKGEPLWSTKRIMQWCRWHGLSPNGPDARPISEASKDADHMDPDVVCRKFVSLSGADSLISRFHPMEKKDDNDSDDSMDVEVVDVEPPLVKQRVVKEEMVELDPALDFLPRSAEALFIQDVAAQIGVRFSPAVLIPGVFASTAEDMIFAAMMEFAGDILQQACSFALSPGSPSHTITPREVFQAIRMLPVANFLSNQHCGIQDPTSPAKR